MACLRLVSRLLHQLHQESNNIVRAVATPLPPARSLPVQATAAAAVGTPASSAKTKTTSAATANALLAVVPADNSTDAATGSCIGTGAQGPSSGLPSGSTGGLSIVVDGSSSPATFPSASRTQSAPQSQSGKKQDSSSWLGRKAYTPPLLRSRPLAPPTQPLTARASSSILPDGMASRSHRSDSFTTPAAAVAAAASAAALDAVACSETGEPATPLSASSVRVSPTFMVEGTFRRKSTSRSQHATP